jgi:hypothetical protein
MNSSPGGTGSEAGWILEFGVFTNFINSAYDSTALNCPPSLALEGERELRLHVVRRAEEKAEARPALRNAASRCR